MILKTNRKLGLLIFLFVFLVYFLTAKGYIEYTDSVFSLRTAESIIHKHSLVIDATEEEAGEAINLYGFQNKKYSKHGIGLPILWIPFVLGGEFFSGILNLPNDRVVQFFISFYNCFFGAGVCLVMFYLLRFFKVACKIAVAVSLILGIGTLCWRYSVSDLSEVSQMFFLLLTVYLIVQKSEKKTLIASFIYFFLILLKITYVIYLPLLFAYLLLRHDSFPSFRSMIPALRFMIPPALAIGLLMFLNYYRSRNLFNFGYSYGLISYLDYQMLVNAFRLLFSLNTGLFIFCPVLFLSVCGFLPFLKQKKNDGLLFIGLIFTNLLFHSTLTYWSGWSWGPRYLVPLIPFYLLPLAYLKLKSLENEKLYSKRGMHTKFLIIPFLLFSISFELIGVMQKDYEYHHIRYNIVNLSFQNKMPPDLLGSAIILKHKIIKNNNKYGLSEFIPNTKKDIKIDTSQYESFKGFNLWYAHLSREYQNKAFYLIPIPFLLLLFFLGFKLYREASHPEIKSSSGI